MTKLSAERHTAIWECEKCAFRMDAMHTHADGTTTCPICELEGIRAERDALAAPAVRLMKWRLETAEENARSVAVMYGADAPAADPRFHLMDVEKELIDALRAAGRPP